MRGETAYTADVTSRMAASQTRVPRDICTPSHDFLKLRALIDNRATGRVGESLRNFGPDLELGSARYAERARPRVETLSPRSIDPKRILHFHPDFHRSLFRFLLLSTILSILTSSNIIHRSIDRKFDLRKEFVQASNMRVYRVSLPRVVFLAHVCSRKNGYSASFFERRLLPSSLPSEN